MGSAIRYANAFCALGDQLETCVDALLAGTQTLTLQHFTALRDPVAIPYFALPTTARPTAEAFIYPQLERLARTALESSGLTAKDCARTAILVGSSSFDVATSEDHYQTELATLGAQQAVSMGIIGYGMLADRLGEALALSAYRHTYSTACTSSANAILYAHRLISMGLVDHALVMGFEFFNQTTLLGFYGLGLISPSQTMRPFAAGRDGLILGEGCGVLVLSKAQGGEPLQLLGGAIATDNHSLTAANADGSTLAAVIHQALTDAGSSAEQIVAIKAHGTASLMNDEAEAAGLCRVFTQQPLIFTLKPFCGHTLGASGALEMALTIGCLKRGLLPASQYANADPTLGIALSDQPTTAPYGHYLFNCFAFGGNNNALILQRGCP